MASAKRSSAGERVLEGRHVIGLFLLMLLFSGVFFTLGYEMGRNQLEGQVRAASTTTQNSNTVLPLKPDAPLKQKSPVSTPGGPAGDETSNGSEGDKGPAPASGWEFYTAGDKKSSPDHVKPLKPAPATATSSAAPKAIATSAKSSTTPLAKPATATTANSHESLFLQVAALRNEADARAIASDLHKKKFPAFVATPQGDKYFRVQVGPYSDQKALAAAKKGLEGAGFKAIVKH